MSDNTKIEWTDATWNPITGCSVVSPGCTNCYAMKLAGSRLRNHPSRAGLTRDTSGGPVWNGTVRFNEQWLNQPLQWKRPRRIFVCAHGDLFHESIPDEWIERVFAIMAQAKQHTFQVLTKRAERMRDHCVDALSNGMSPLPNVWLGVSTEDQKRADERIPLLLETPAAVRWLSCEPLIGPVNPWADAIAALVDHNGPGIDWIVAGGESGDGARPMHPWWARILRDACAVTDVPFFFKQWGAWEPIDEWQPWDRFPQIAIRADGTRMPDEEWLDGGQRFKRSGKKVAGRLLDGIEHNAYPVTP